MERIPIIFKVIIFAFFYGDIFSNTLPHQSFFFLPSSNGRSVVIYNAKDGVVDGFYPHLYKSYDENSITPDLCYDTYFGIKVDEKRVWLKYLKDIYVGYENGSGILRIIKNFNGIEITNYVFSPMLFNGKGFIMIAKVRNIENKKKSVNFYSLLNFHTGKGTPEPSFENERIKYNPEYDEFIEKGENSSNLFIYRSLTPSFHHAISPNNPFNLLNEGKDFTDDLDSGLIDDAVCGFQWKVGKGFLNKGEETFFGVFAGYISNKNESELREKINNFLKTNTPAQIIENERSFWKKWHEKTLPIKNIKGDTLGLLRQSLAFLKMAVVHEEGKTRGQIPASLPPGMWNITWVRDSAYAIVALILTSHYEEAKEGLEFMLNANAGKYKEFVGMPYLISLCRYYGNGDEWSDGNPLFEGYNIEFDNFGLFLWAFETYVQKTMDMDFLNKNYIKVSQLLSDVLLFLIDEKYGVVKPDSSIWERHWNGNEKHFSYTTIMAIKGLCSSSKLAEFQGDKEGIKKYRNGAKKLLEGFLKNMVVKPSMVIAGSIEEIKTGKFFDASVIEAINLGIVDKDGEISLNTFNAIKEKLGIKNTKGFKRNDDGDYYDEQEWVFIDLRVSNALKIMGKDKEGNSIKEWVIAQAKENFFIIPELFNKENGDYEGSAPMIGYGAGVFILSFFEDYFYNDIKDCLSETKIEEESLISEEFEQYETIFSEKEYYPSEIEKSEKSSPHCSCKINRHGESLNLNIVLILLIQFLCLYARKH